MALHRYSQAVQLTLGILGSYMTWYLAFGNGTAAQIAAFHSLDFLPESEVPIRRTFTGVNAVDKYLAVMNCVGWLMVGGNHPGVSLHTYLFCGQFAAAYGILMIEASRNGNYNKATSYVLIWGLLMRAGGWATVGAVLSMLHLSTSPSIEPSAPNLAVNAIDSLSTFAAMTGGYFLPSILAGLPAPSVVTYDQKQITMAIWQAFPIWISALYFISKRTLAYVIPSSAYNSSSEKLELDMEALRFTYSTLLLVAGFTHVHAWSLSLTASHLSPLFAPHIADVLDSTAFFPIEQALSITNSNIHRGVALWLQWDEIIGTSAFFFWTLTLYVQAKHQNEQRLGLRLWLQLLVGTTVAGPTTGAIALVWARDELVTSIQTRKKRVSGD
ncbi:hypothetical protein MMC13_006456 [Lambiella insularis]|nr:hypothetical protein [Lambiella insularis]